jgi:hypothetical protein
MYAIAVYEFPVPLQCRYSRIGIGYSNTVGQETQEVSILRSVPACSSPAHSTHPSIEIAPELFTAKLFHYMYSCNHFIISM